MVSFKIEVVIASIPIFYLFIHFSLLSDHVYCSYMVNTSTTSSSPLSITRFTLGLPPFTWIIYKLFDSVFLFSFLFYPWICLLTPFSRSRPDLRCACGKQLTFALQIYGLFWHWAYDPSCGSMGFHIINFIWLRSTGTYIRLSCISVFDQMNGRLNCFYHIASWLRMKSSFQGLVTCVCLFERRKTFWCDLLPCPPLLIYKV